MYLSLGNYHVKLLDAVWLFYFVMITSLTTAVPHIQMFGIVLLVLSTLLEITYGDRMFQTFEIRKTRVYPFTGWYLVFIGYVICSQFWAVYAYDSGTVGGYIRIVIDLICLSIYLDSKESVYKAMKMFVFAACVSVVLFLLTSDPSSWGTEYVSCGITGLHRNTMGFMCSFSALIAIWLNSHNSGSRFLKVAAAILVVGVLCSGSRTNLIVLALYFVLYIIFLDNISNKIKWLLGALLVVFILAIIISLVGVSEGFLDKYVNRIVAIFDSSYSDSSMDYRAQLKVNAWMLFQRYPIFGAGLTAINTFNGLQGYAEIGAHSNYYDLLANYGIVGLVLYYIMYVYIIVKGLRNRKSDDGWKFAMMMFIILAITEYQTGHEFTYIGVFLYAMIFANAQYYSEDAGLYEVYDMGDDAYE